ncbi:hypothetical protein BMIN_0410 [Bifidobacterium minimum]|uniref:Uncharacterized protein n=1 Tax=Bifidobacterium minimum TaxID=1693 RepID=A0A087BNB4_9BIFI|nr:hypothetical protein BMIN_0410 [Bifidobacterium minimum]
MTKTASQKPRTSADIPPTHPTEATPAADPSATSDATPVLEMREVSYSYTKGGKKFLTMSATAFPPAGSTPSPAPQEWGRPPCCP